MFTNFVDFVVQGEMKRSLAIFNVFRMAGATAFSHEIRVGRLGYQPCMCCLLISSLFVTPMAIDTREIVALVMPYVCMTGSASHKLY